MNKIQMIKVPLLEKVLEISSNMLIVFKILVEKFNLTALVFDKVPKLREVVSPELVTLVLTVIVGLTLIAVVFGVLINLCKLTLNFTIFIKWAGIIILGVGFIYNLF